MSARSALTRACRGVRWYVREVTGESAYDRYLEHASRAHDGVAALDRRSFERQRQDLENARPQQRCC